MQMPTLRVDDDVKVQLESLGKFGDTHNSILRRLLHIDGPQPKAPMPKTRAKKGTITRIHFYKEFILATLLQMPGLQATSAVVTDLCEQYMQGKWMPADLEPLASGAIRWTNKLQWARQALVDEGLLAGDTEHGVWKLTSKGMTEARNLR